MKGKLYNRIINLVKNAPCLSDELEATVVTQYIPHPSNDCMHDCELKRMSYGIPVSNPLLYTPGEEKIEFHNLCEIFLKFGFEKFETQLRNAKRGVAIIGGLEE